MMEMNVASMSMPVIPNTEFTPGTKTSGAGRSCECNYMEPGVVFKQGSKTLTYHTCCADYTDIVLFFHGNVSFLFLQ